MKDFIRFFLIVLVACIVRKILSLDNSSMGIDDANIYFVYARNLYEGHGLVYTIGGERVEGFTSVTWMGLLTILYSLKFIFHFETAILILCFFITVGITFLYFRFVKKAFNEFWAWILVLYILLIPGFIDWNVFALMDISIWTFAITLTTLLLLSGQSKGLFFSVTVLLPFIRPEGMALAFILFFLKLLKDYSNDFTLRQIVKNNLVFLICILLSIISLTLFREFYFGYPLPNTFYAKVSMSFGDNIKQAFFYLYDALKHTTFLPFILLIISFVSLLRNQYLKNWKNNASLLILFAIILFFIFYPFLTGADHFKYSRFFQPVFPIIGLLFIYVFYKKVQLKKPAIIVCVGVALFLLNFNSKDNSSLRKNWRLAIGSYFSGFSPDFLSHSQLQSEFDIAVYGRQLSNYMNQVLSVCDSFPSYGVVAAGGIGYIYKGKTIDLMGLNNPEMAHANKIKKGVKNHGSFNKNVFYEQNPDIFLTWPDPLTSTVEQNDSSALEFLKRLKDSTYFINRVCDHIFNDPQFNRIYSFSRISNGRLHFYGFIKLEQFIRQFPELAVARMN